MEKLKNNAKRSAAQGILAILQVCTAWRHVPCIHNLPSTGHLNVCSVTSPPNFALTLDLTDGPCGYKLKLSQRSSISLCADHNKVNYQLVCCELECLSHKCSEMLMLGLTNSHETESKAPEQVLEANQESLQKCLKGLADLKRANKIVDRMRKDNHQAKPLELKHKIGYTN